MRDDFFDNLIHEKADEHQAPVPSDVWANIIQKKKKRRFILWCSMGILLFAGLSITGLYQFKQMAHPPVIATKKSDEQTGRKNFTGKKNNIATGNANTKAVTTETFLDNGNQQDEHVTAATKTIIRHTADKHLSRPVQKDSEHALVSIAGNRKNIYNAKITGENKLLPEETASITSATDNYTVMRNNKKKQKGKSNIQIKNGSSEELTTDDAPVELSTSLPLVNTDIKNPPGELSQEVLWKAVKKKTDTVATISTINLAKDTLNMLVSKAKKNKKGTLKSQLFMEASVTPFLGIQNNNQLLSVTRLTVTPIRKTEFIATDIHASIQSSLGYQLALRKNISQKLSLSSGIQYSFIKENVRLSGIEITTNYDVVKRLDPNNGSPRLYDDTLAIINTGRRIINATNSYQFISIPLLANYEVINKKSWSLSVTGGTYLNIVNYKNSIAGNLQTVYQNGPGKNGADTKFTADVFAGVRFSRRFGKRYYLFAEPELRYSLIKYDMPDVVNKKYIHRAGLSMGISWKMGK